MENQDLRNPQPEQANNIAKRVQQLSVETARAQESAEQALSEAEHMRFDVETCKESARSHRNSQAGLWSVFAILALALGGLAWYGSRAEQGMNGRLANLPALEQSLQAVDERIGATEDKLEAQTNDWIGLGDRPSKVESRITSDFRLVRDYAREQANQVHRQVLAELDNRTEWIETHMTRMESTQESQRARIAQLQEEIARVRSEARSELNEQIAQVRRDTEREMDGLHARGAGTRSDLDAMVWRLDRRHVDFELSRNQSREVIPGISITLKDTNVPYQRVEEGWLHVVPDGRILWVRSQGIQQPMIFYTQQDSRPYELVFTRITRDGAFGYLVHPGGPPVTTSASGPRTDEAELSASAAETR